jgi:hypothetical protein
VDGGHKKGKYKELTSPTVGSICRKDLRLPVKRMGKGFVVILDMERIDALRVKYGLVKQSADGKYEPMVAAAPTQIKDGFGEGSDEEPEQEELL